MDEFDRGVELFNSGEYYECHEVLEHYWNTQPEPDRQLTQAIIQIAVALYHARRDNLEGTRRLLRRALDRLNRWEGSDGSQARIDACKLRKDATAALESAEREQRPQKITITP